MTDSLQSKAGKASAAKMTQQQKRDRSLKGALSRWHKIDNKPPFAKYQGFLCLGGEEIDCYVLNTGERVLSISATVKAISHKNSGNLGNYIGIEGLKPFIDNDLFAGEIVDFDIPGNPTKARGVTAENFILLCNAYVSALTQGTLKTPRQKEIALQCAVFSTACAKTGLLALIDEATGYQYDREKDALQVKIMAFIAEELRAWEKTFPDQLWEEFGRLSNWETPLRSRPKWWGKLVIELIYNTLDPDVAEYLKENKPEPGVCWHQQLTKNYGVRQLVSRCHEVVGVAKTCKSIGELREKVSHYYGKKPIQLTFLDYR